MNVHFRIEYVNKHGDIVESMSSTDDPKVLHELLDEYLKHNTVWNDHSSDGIGFHVGSECKCNK